MFLSESVLPVPYFTQPTSNTCQSTCLRMFAVYLENQVLFRSTGAGEKDIMTIWKEINTGDKRPSKNRNAYQNMQWWLETHFSPMKFEIASTKSSDEAIDRVVRYIDRGYPVMVSTNHSRTDGHIILVVGYKNYVRARKTCSPDFYAKVRFVCHDPYGKFDPELDSKLFGKRRHDYGMTMASGGEVGPGKSVNYSLKGIRRNRADKHSASTFFLISAKI